MIHKFSRYLLTLVALLTMTTGAWADPNILVPTITGDREFYESVEVTMICTSQNACIYYTLDGKTSPYDDSKSIEFRKNQAPIVLTETTTILAASYDGDNWSDVVEVKFTKLTGPKVTYNDTKTEASFEMPAYDATLNYELVRDMGYKVAFSGVPTRARLAKDGEGKFHFADGLTFQLLDNIDAANPKDITSAEGITFMVGEVEAVDFEGHTFYQLNKETLVPLADFLADAHLGNYAICAMASTGEYDGSFSSDMITLFQGYEVTIPAGEYITYYRDEPLKLDDNETNAELYTISAVGTETATLSGPYDAMKALTPMLVHNKNTEEAKTILLIPCNEPDLALTVAPEFKGTLEATEIAASSATSNNYAFNGKQFVWVKNAIEVGANRAWLHILTGAQSAPVLNLVFEGEVTGISEMVNGKSVNGQWYDLNGRKLQNKPTKKGIYILNGKKVVVK